MVDGKEGAGDGASGRKSETKENADRMRRCRMMRRPPADSFLLTVDDGPNGRTTPMLLDSFRDADARAVFFMVGINIDEGAHPIMQRMVK